MEKRVYFKSSRLRKLFFDKTLNINEFKDWKELYLSLGLSRGTFDKYKSGFLTIPLDLYKKISVGLSKEELDKFSKNIKFIERNWGQVKGGNITYFKYKEVFESGRKKGLKKLLKKSHKFDINLPLSRNLSYFIGLFIAEGFTNKYARYYLTQFVGHKSEEYIFYTEFFSSLAKNLFGIMPHIRDVSYANAIRVNFYSRDLFEMITKRFGIKAGRKSDIVLIPEKILEAQKDILLSCISGIYDGEACFFVDKRERYKKPYPRIDLHMVNPDILKQISNILNNVGIKHSISGNYVRIYIYGDRNIKDFLDKVGFLNPKHIRKLEDYFGRQIALKKLI